MSVPMTLSDLERWDARVNFFLEDLQNYARTVCPRMTECKFHIMEDERQVPKMEGKTNFSRRLKQCQRTASDGGSS